jgi:hypothetical protein
MMKGVLFLPKQRTLKGDIVVKTNARIAHGIMEN